MSQLPSEHLKCTPESEPDHYTVECPLLRLIKNLGDSVEDTDDEIDDSEHAVHTYLLETCLRYRISNNILPHELQA